MRAELVKLYLFAFACFKTVFAQQSEYGQCGGIGWTGPTTCVSPYVCEVFNPYYHQCIAGTTTFISTTRIPTTTFISTTRLPSTTCDTPSGSRSTSSGSLSTSSASPSPVYPSTATPMKTFFGSRWYGSALAVDHLENDSTYKKVASFNLDAATAENECKMDALEPEQNVFEFTNCDYIYDFISGLGGKFRGHNLVWDSQIPSWVNSLATSAIESAMKNHITNVIEHYAGEAYCWDVVNEPFNSDGTYASSPWYSAMGASYLEIAYSTARSVNSGAKLYLNDYNIEYPGPKSTAALNLTTVLKGLGLIDGIGFEAHYIVGEVPDSSDVAAQFAALGVEIWYTELDIRMPVPSTSDSLEQQWGDYASVTLYCARQPACVGITTWGFTDLYSWIPSTFSGYGSALPWDSTYSAKPAWTGIAENAGI